jgi:hypothetical protein
MTRQCGYRDRANNTDDGHDDQHLDERVTFHHYPLHPGLQQRYTPILPNRAGLTRQSFTLQMNHVRFRWYVRALPLSYNHRSGQMESNHHHVLSRHVTNDAT